MLSEELKKMEQFLGSVGIQPFSITTRETRIFIQKQINAALELEGGARFKKHHDFTKAPFWLSVDLAFMELGNDHLPIQNYDDLVNTVQDLLKLKKGIDELGDLSINFFTNWLSRSRE